MGIHGLLKNLGPPDRISLAKLSSQHFTTHSRPLRLAVDISIWLFQIQSGKGGSNPALRTFYYRLIRLLTLSTHPLFVFDGPNKPLFKRNKKVGGPGVRVATVPEFLAKQLLKLFGVPWHVAPGEAEAECALLQREGVVDAVLSEDVDTLMFGSGMTLRNWGSENTTKSPTHVDVYRAEVTRERSRGLEREGMVLVALMSGGDYLPEGVPGVGVKVACDAARAGFGRSLCGLDRKDGLGLKKWREGLEYEMRTNESKFFSRRNATFTIPEDFPNLEVLGFYTHPCVSTPEKVERLRRELQWDQPIDFAALRTFAADAFDWRCRGGAKKFIKNLAPAVLMRELRLRSSNLPTDGGDDAEAQEQHEKSLVQAIHGKRNHSTTDGELEYRISFVPATFVPIDLSLEEEDDEFIPAGGVVDSDAESECPASTQQPQVDDDEAPGSPTKKKRNFKPFDPSQPEKLWILKPFLQVGCPLLVEDYEASFNDPREFLKQRHKARKAGGRDAGVANVHGKSAGTAAGAKKVGGSKKKNNGVEKDKQEGAIMGYAKVTKAVQREGERGVLGDVCLNARTGSQESCAPVGKASVGEVRALPTFRMPASQIRAELLSDNSTLAKSSEKRTGYTNGEQTSKALTNALSSRPFAAFADPGRCETSIKPATSSSQKGNVQRTPKRNKKRTQPDLPSPAMSQRTITSFYSPSPTPRKQRSVSAHDVINLVSSSPVAPISPKEQPRALIERPLTPTPPNTRFRFMRDVDVDVELETETDVRRLDFSPGKLPDTVTKRRKKGGGLKRWQTEPVLFNSGLSEDENGVELELPPISPMGGGGFLVEDAEPTPKLTKFEKREISLRSTSPAYESMRSTVSREPSQPARRLTRDQEPFMPTPPTTSQSTITTASTTTLPHRPSPKKAAKPKPKAMAMAKKRIELRDSLQGWWREVEAETVDLSGDGSGWKISGGRAKIVGVGVGGAGTGLIGVPGVGVDVGTGVGVDAGGAKRPGGGWRKSGIEVLDLTGAS